jgi:hypothetical protein
MKIRIPLFSALLCVFLFPGFAQEETAEGINQYNNSIFVINSFVFNVDGITRPFALINAAGLIAGEEITGLSNLESYIQNKQQLLYNERVLESARIEYSIGQIRQDGKYPVDLVIYVKDTWNIIAIPYPKYNSNTGFELILKARDYNFLGTMNSLRLDLGYRYDEKGRNFFTSMLDSGIPFRALGLDWFFDFDNYFDYRPDMEEPFYFKNITGLSVQLPVGPTTITASFNESLIYNEAKWDDSFQHGIYMSSNPYISWGIPTGIEIGNYGGLTYTPEISATFNHEFSQWPLSENRKDPSLNFGHSLGFGRIDWIDNFLKGYSASISNYFDYSFYDLRNDRQPLSANYSIRGTGHFIVTDNFGISSRLMYRHWINYSNDNAGDVLRGVMDKDVNADYMLSLNLDLNFKVLKFRPSEWFNSSKWRLFDFDLHLVPIMDAALSHNPESGTVLGFNRLNLTGGLELIVFPNFFRSLFLRASIATDIYEILAYKKRSLELFIGMELHY